MEQYDAMMLREQLARWAEKWAAGTSSSLGCGRADLNKAEEESIEQHDLPARLRRCELGRHEAETRVEHRPQRGDGVAIVGVPVGRVLDEQGDAKGEAERDDEEEQQEGDDAFEDVDDHVHQRAELERAAEVEEGSHVEGDDQPPAWHGVRGEWGYVRHEQMRGHADEANSGSGEPPRFGFRGAHDCSVR